MAGRDSGESLQDLAYLGREFLTWLLFHVDQGEDTFGKGDEAFAVAFCGRVRLKALAGDVTDAALKGGTAAYGVETRAALGAGRSLREAELRISRGDREWRCVLEADTLDLKSVKLPALLSEEDDDRFLERMSLLEELDQMVRVALCEFLHRRARPAWQRSEVPAIRKWLADALRVEG